MASRGVPVARNRYQIVRGLARTEQTFPGYQAKSREGCRADGIAPLGHEQHHAGPGGEGGGGQEGAKLEQAGCES